ncbi:tetratricopeptide repeat protein [Ktedonobacter sp. SOSP1-52]|uniref:tetratricopeptide repeat protein n=1 Tax=Ktedonobacter sp. SOSP1-52 TaxID=2778366 RepID=UPI001915017C
MCEKQASWTGLQYQASKENPTVLYNRGIAYQAQNRWQEAINDFTQALALSNEDAQDILYRRSFCFAQLGTPIRLERPSGAASVKAIEGDHAERGDMTLKES